MRYPGWPDRGADSRSIDQVVAAFEASIKSGRPSLQRFWSGLGSAQNPATLAALIKVELWWRFESGERPRVLDYLKEFPILAQDSERVISLIYEEFCLLQENGEDPDSEVFCRDYEPWSDSLCSQLDYHRDLSRAIGAEAPPVKFPELGETFEKYRLTSLLGVGGVARVYLATEEELGGRQVAIKVSASFGQEPSILAKLDHRNIVPILTVAESASGLQGICMPYRPGPTLEGMIRRIGRGKPPRSARAIVDAMQTRDCPRGISPEEQEAGWSDFPIDRTFAEAVAWIGQSLALTLSYLHKQGIFHRDIKPANILLAYREGPQLLDFNLAKVLNNPEGASAAQRGGTLPYMAPEQLRAFLDPSAWGSVDEAADLYSLGLVLRELLTGQPPELPTSRGSLIREIRSLIDRRLIPSESIREVNPGVPPALESIIDKCLAFDPKNRYRDAADLERDLRLFLQRKPLLNAPNTSKFERGINWVHRNRHQLTAAILSSVLLMPTIGLLAREDDGLGEFVRAEAFLDSGIREGFLQAKQAFKVLVEKRPNSARALLGLALTLRKLFDPDKIQINNLFKEAVRKQDAEEAFRRRLVKEPDSPTLLLNLGIVLLDKGLLDPAREYLGRSLRVDNEGLMALAALAKLERKAERYEVAASYLADAVEIAERKGVPAKMLYDLRQVLMNSLLQLIDQDLEAKGSTEARKRAADRFRPLESNVRSFDEDWGKINNAGELDEHHFALAYFEGCLHSIGGVLEANDADPGQSSSRFDRAEARFGVARVLGSRLDSTADRLQQVSDQVEKLKARRKSTPVGR